MTDAAVDPTCTATGLTAGSHCARCDTVLEAQEEIPALGHDWGEYVETKAPTCTAAGEETAECSRCGALHVKILDSQHTGLELIPAVAPTCTEPGNEKGSRCNDCGVVLVSPNPIPALGHDWGAYVQTKAPTCTTDGAETAACNRCEVTQTRSIAAKGHSAVIDAAVEATCTQPGKTEGSHCARCNIVLIAQNIVPALGHSWSGYVQTQAPTCTVDGIETSVCSRCGGEQTRRISASGHSWAAWEEDRVSCDVAGERIRTCTVCGEKEYQALAAGEHSWDDGIISKIPTCTMGGIRIKTCELCGDTMTETVSALGHDMDHHAAVAATEAMGGNIEYWQCSRCGRCFSDAEGRVEIAAEDTLIPPLGDIAAEDPAGTAWWVWAAIAGGVAVLIAFIAVIGVVGTRRASAVNPGKRKNKRSKR